MIYYGLSPLLWNSSRIPQGKCRHVLMCSVKCRDEQLSAYKLGKLNKLLEWKSAASCHGGSWSICQVWSPRTGKHGDKSSVVVTQTVSAFPWKEYFGQGGVLRNRDVIHIAATKIHLVFLFVHLRLCGKASAQFQEGSLLIRYRLLLNSCCSLPPDYLVIYRKPASCRGHHLVMIQVHIHGSVKWGGAVTVLYNGILITQALWKTIQLLQEFFRSLLNEKVHSSFCHHFKKQVVGFARCSCVVFLNSGFGDLCEVKQTFNLI